MRVVEFRLFMPTTPEQYKRCQLYMVAKASLEEGGVDGMQILVNEPFQDEEVSGQYTLKKINFASNIPSWVLAFLDSRLVIFDEISWNTFPKLKTKYTSHMFPEANITVDSHHYAGINTHENALDLPPEILAQRRIVEIDIVNDPVSAKGSKPDIDISRFESTKAGLGPFKSNWQLTTQPIMTCYKVLTVDLPYFGLLSSKIESWVMAAMQEKMLLYHRKAVCWMDEWYDLSMDDIRKMEAEVKMKLDNIWTTKRRSLPPSIVLEATDALPSTGVSLASMPPLVNGKEMMQILPTDAAASSSEFTVEKTKEIVVKNEGRESVLPAASLLPSTVSLENGRKNNEFLLRGRLEGTYCGYIYKLGDGLWNTTWNRRYVVLSGSRVWYYNDPRESRAKDSIDILGSHISWVGDLKLRSHSILVQPVGRRLLYLSGENEGETRMWMLRLQAAAGECTRGESSRETPSSTIASTGESVSTPAFSNISSEKVLPPQKVGVLSSSSGGEPPKVETEKTTSSNALSTPLKGDTEKESITFYSNNLVNESGVNLPSSRHFSTSGLGPSNKHSIDFQNTQACLHELANAMDEVGYTFVQNENGVRLAVKDISKWQTLALFSSSATSFFPSSSIPSPAIPSSPPRHAKDFFPEGKNSQNTFSPFSLLLGCLCLLVGLYNMCVCGKRLVWITFMFSISWLQRPWGGGGGWLPSTQLSLLLLLPLSLSIVFFLLTGFFFSFFFKAEEPLEDIWKPSTLHSRIKYVVKATTTIPSTAVELFAILMDTEQKNDWILGHQQSFRMDGGDTGNDHVYERFLPLAGDFPLTLLTLSMHGFLAPRELYRQRWWKICKDGSYIIILYSSKEVKRALQRALQKSVEMPVLDLSPPPSRLSRFYPWTWWKTLSTCFFSSLLGSPPFSPVESEGFEIFLLTPVATKRKCLVTFLHGLHLHGNLPSWFCEMVLLARAKAIAGLRGLILSYRGHALMPAFEEATERFTNAFWESSQDEVLSSNAALAGLSNILKKRKKWPLVGFRRNTLGGLICTDEAIIQKQKGVILEVLKAGGKAIVEGKGLVGLSLPVRIFEPYSMLESVAKTWGFGPIFFSMAAASDDAVERLKYAVTFAVASLHCACFKLKPFNPILGETFQGGWEDGANVFLEHTSHHPPIAHFLVEGPENRYKFWGYYEFKGSVKGNAGISIQDGPNILEFSDGSRIEWRLPFCRLSGLLWGHRVYEWLEKMEFSDSTNQLTCVLQFGAETKPFVGRMRIPSEIFKGKIYKKGDVLCQVTGSWLDGIQFDDKRYWNLLDYEPLPLHRTEKHILPSDCRYREDAVQLGLGNEAESQKWKVILEVKQRKDRHNRMEYRKAHGIPDPFCT